MVGTAIARDLEALQDKLPPFPQAEAEAVIAAAFDRPVAASYVSFGPPVAAASIAQVHRAEVEHNGERRAFAVKILRPGIERRFRADLASFYFAARNAEAASAEARRLRLVEVVATLDRSVRLEMDFRLEAAALSEMAENTRDDSDFRVPAVDWDRTAREVLTMEWIDGTPLHDRETLSARGYDLPALGRKVIQSFLRHALRDGFFHADMHPGNLFVDARRPAGRGRFRHHGPARSEGAPLPGRNPVRLHHPRLSAHRRRCISMPVTCRAHHSVENFAQAIRAIGEPIHNRSAEDISMAKLLMLLFEVTGLFDMRTRPELLLLQKTMVVVEGVARSLDPKLDMWTTADPVVREWIERHLGAAGNWKTRPRAPASSAASSAQVPALARAARGALLEQFDDHHPQRPGAVAGDRRGHRPRRARRNRWTAAGCGRSRCCWLALVAWKLRSSAGRTPRLLHQLLQFVDALRPTRLHAGQHLRRDRYQPTACDSSSSWFCRRAR